MSLELRLQRLERIAATAIKTTEERARMATFVAYSTLAANDGTTVESAVETACQLFSITVEQASQHSDWDALQAFYESEPDA